LLGAFDEFHDKDWGDLSEAGLSFNDELQGWQARDGVVAANCIDDPAGPDPEHVGDD
jgi:hypothetical protein